MFARAHTHCTHIHTHRNTETFSRHQKPTKSHQNIKNNSDGMYRNYLRFRSTCYRALFIPKYIHVTIGLGWPIPGSSYLTIIICTPISAPYKMDIILYEANALVSVHIVDIK